MTLKVILIVNFLISANSLLGMQNIAVQQRDVYLFSNDGKSLKLKADAVAHVGWITSACAADQAVGTPQAKLSMQYGIAQLTLLDRLLGLIIKQDFDDLEHVELEDMSLEGLADLIKMSKSLQINLLYSYATRVFVRKINATLGEFVALADWISRFGFEEAVLKDLGKLVLSESERNILRASMYTDLVGEYSPHHISFSTFDDYAVTWGGRASGEGFCKVWDIKHGIVAYDVTLPSEILQVIFCGGSLIIRTQSAIFKCDVRKPYAKGEVIISTSDNNILLQQLNLVEQQIWGMALSNDSSKLIVGIGNLLVVRDMKSRRNKVLVAHSGELFALGEGAYLEVTPDNSSIIEIRSNGLVRFWDLFTEKCYKVANEHYAPIAKLMVASQNKLLTASDNNVLCSWNVAQAAQGALTGKWTLQRVLCASPSGKYVLLANHDKGGSIFNTEAATADKAPLKSDQKFINGRFHTDDVTVATLSNKNEVCLWNSQTGSALVGVVLNHPVRVIEFSPDGNSLALNHALGVVRLWHYSNERLADYIARQLALDQALLLKQVALVRARYADDDRGFKDAMKQLILAKHLGELCDSLDPELIELLKLREIAVDSADSQGRTSLHKAVIAKQLQTVETLLARGADINARDSQGNTALHLAAADGFTDVLPVLCAYKPDMNQHNSEGWTPLHEASKNGHCNAVRFLVSRGAQINKGNQKGGIFDKFTPLHICAELGLAEIVELLLSLGADPNARDLYRCKPLTRAIWNGHKTVVEILLRHRVQVEKKPQALHVKKLSGALKHPNVVEVLLQHGIKDINSPYGEPGDQKWTVMQYAMSSGNIALCKLLYAYGATFEDGWQPPFDWAELQLAAESGDLDKVKLLSKKPNVKIDEKVCYYTALQRAAMNNHIDVVRHLASCGANVNELCDITEHSQGMTPLCKAVLANQLEVVRCLIECGAEVESENGDKSNGDTVYFAASRSLDMVKLLVSNGAGFDRSANHHTPLSTAAYSGKTDIISFLLDKGARVDGYDGDDRPLHQAINYGHWSSVKLLLDRGADPRKQDRDGKTALELVKKPYRATEEARLYMKSLIEEALNRYQ